MCGGLSDAGMQLSLTDVLLHLGQEATDRFIRQLKDDNSIKSARASCHALRDFVDGNMTSIRLELRRDTTELWQGGTLPPVPLQRWTRCTSVELCVDVEDPDDPMAVQHVSELLMLPFSRIPLATRQRITHLTVRDLYDPVVLPAAALSLVLHRLPALRGLWVETLADDNMSVDVLYDAFAALAHLQYICLPAWSGLNRAGLLAEAGCGASLRLGVYSTGTMDIGRDMLAGIARIPNLHHLQLSWGDVIMGDLHGLLCSLAASSQGLRYVELLRGATLAYELTDLQQPFAHEGVVVSMQGGHVTSIATRGDMSLAELADLMDALPLPSGVQALPLGSFRLDMLSVDKGCMELLEDPEVQALLQRCDRGVVSCLDVGAGVPPSAVLSALSLLGLPKSLHLSCAALGCVSIQLSPPGRSPPPLPPPAAAPDGRSPSLLHLALDRFATRVTGAEEAQAAGDGSAANSCAGANGGGGASTGGRLHVVLIRGPLLSALGWAPEALSAWVKKLAGAANGAVEGAGAAAGGEPGQTVRACSAYLHLRGAAAVLLLCDTAAGAAAVLKEARKMAAAAEAEAAGFGSGGPLLRAWRLEAGAHLRGKQQLCDCVIDQVKQVMQSVWDGEGMAAEWSTRQRLTWLLEQWKGVLVPLPRTVHL